MGKKEHKSKILSELKLKKADQKLIWKLLDKLDAPRNNDKQSYLSIAGTLYSGHLVIADTFFAARQNPSI